MQSWSLTNPKPVTSQDADLAVIVVTHGPANRHTRVVVSIHFSVSYAILNTVSPEQTSTPLSPSPSGRESFDMSLCPESENRAAMTDEEFWAYVFPNFTPEEEQSWAEYHWAMDGPDIWAYTCARCGSTVEVDEEFRHEAEHDAFCDNCVDNMLPDLEDVL
jgi:hypothetical protein